MITLEYFSFETCLYMAVTYYILNGCISYLRLNIYYFNDMIFLFIIFYYIFYIQFFIRLFDFFIPSGINYSIYSNFMNLS